MNKGKKSKLGKAVSILLSICLMVQPLQVCATEGIVTEDVVTDHTAPESAAIESAAPESTSR